MGQATPLAGADVDWCNSSSSEPLWLPVTVGEKGTEAEVAAKGCSTSIMAGTLRAKRQHFCGKRPDVVVK